MRYLAPLAELLDEVGDDPLEGRQHVEEPQLLPAARLQPGRGALLLLLQCADGAGHEEAQLRRVHLAHALPAASAGDNDEIQK